MKRRITEMKVQKMLQERQAKLAGQNLLNQSNSIESRNIVTGTLSSGGFSGFHNQN